MSSKTTSIADLPVAHLLYHSRQRFFLQRHNKTALSHTCMRTQHKRHTPAAQLLCFSVREPNSCFSNDMLLWDRGSTTIPAGWKPCLLGRGNPKARRHFVNNVALGAQSPLCTEIKARLLPCLPLSYPAISGQPCGYPVKMSSGSVVDPVDGLSLVAAKRVNESEASAGNARANGKFSWRGRIGRDLKRNYFVSRKAQSNTPE